MTPPEPNHTTPSSQHAWCWFTRDKRPIGADGHAKAWNAEGHQATLADVSAEVPGRFPFIGYMPGPGRPIIIDYDAPKPGEDDRIPQADIDAEFKRLVEEGHCVERSVSGKGIHLAVYCDETVPSRSSNGVEVFGHGDRKRGILCATRSFAFAIDNAKTVSRQWLRERVEKWWTDPEPQPRRVAANAPCNADERRFARADILGALGTPADRRDGRDYWECPHPAHPTPCDKPSLDLSDGEYPVWGCFSCQTHGRMPEVNRLVAKRVGDYMDRTKTPRKEAKPMTDIRGNEPVELVQPVFADRFIADRGRDFIWDTSAWWRYDEAARRWSRDREERYLLSIEETVQAMLPPHNPDDKAALAARKTWQRDDAYAAIAKLSRRRPGIQRHPDEIGKHDHLVGVPDGRTYDLRTNHARESMRGDLLTHSLGVEPAPGDASPVDRTFKAWLSPKYGKDTRAALLLLKTILGAYIAGDKRFQRFLCFTGPSGSGKTACAMFVKAIFGDYAVFIEPDKIVTGHAGHENWKMRLRHPRLAVVTDIGERRTFRSKLINEVTDGTPITGNYMYQDEVQFTPRANFLLACNDLPAADESLQRRMALFIFVGNYDEDLDDSEDVIATEELVRQLMPNAPAFAYSCLTALRKAIGGGLPEVPAMTEDKRRIAAERSFVADFIGQCLVATDDWHDWVSRKDIFNACRAFAERNGINPDVPSRFTQATMTTTMNKHRYGSAPHRRNTGWGYCKLKLRTPAE